jgi:SAM-dependent methyltransferase
VTYSSVYDPAMAAAYVQGRSLRAADVAAWMAAARPFLPGPDGRVLDLGAGTGRFTAALAEGCGATVVAAEPSAAMRTAFVPVGGMIVGAAAERLPFAAGCFDAVWASQILHHVRDLAAFAQSVRHVLRPGGHLLIRGAFGGVDELSLAPYFPSAFVSGGPLLDAATNHLASAGVTRRARLTVPARFAGDADELIAKVASRSLSNLAALPDETFHDGLTRLKADATSGRIAFPIEEHLDLVVFQAGPPSGS